MPETGLHVKTLSSMEIGPLDPRLLQAVRKLEMDSLTAEVVSIFGVEGIEALVLKGPVLAAWLYPGELRVYRDSDIMVAPKDRARAVGLLEEMGFRSWALAPLSVDPGGTDFRLGDKSVDLHSAIPGLFGSPESIWADISARSERLHVGGIELSIPDRDTLLLHVVVHAGHHANMAAFRAFEDLRRAIACSCEEQWQRALDLARTYDGVAAFAAGLRTVPGGRELAVGLGVDNVLTHRFCLRSENDAIAEEITALFTSNTGRKQKLATVVGELFPRPPYMRYWSPLARHGGIGLMAAYIWRPLWALGQIPRALRTLWRVRRTMRAHGGTPP
jgi:Uncharacterised nucleotidyltransferase